MKAAIVKEVGKAPVYGDFFDPIAQDGEVRVAVMASALSNLTRGRASGTHYSSAGKLPFVPGVDGIGRLDDGQRVYFVLPDPRLAEWVRRRWLTSTAASRFPKSWTT